MHRQPAREPPGGDSSIRPEELPYAVRNSEMRWGCSNGWVPVDWNRPCALRRRFLRAHCRPAGRCRRRAALGVVLHGRARPHALCGRSRQGGAVRVGAGGGVNRFPVFWVRAFTRQPLFVKHRGPFAGRTSDLEEGAYVTEDRWNHRNRHGRSGNVRRFDGRHCDGSIDTGDGDISRADGATRGGGL